ncbi:MAG: hypothetical protein ACRC8S_14065 [Fimbriiglobus sp.]
MARFVPNIPVVEIDGRYFVEQERDWEQHLGLWCYYIEWCVYAQASSLHYHPWRTNGKLCLVINERRLLLSPPPDDLAYRLALSAGEMMSNRLSGFLRRRIGWPFQACSHVLFHPPVGPAQFLGVVWKRDRYFGVDWYRTDHPNPPPARALEEAFEIQERLERGELPGDPVREA